MKTKTIILPVLTIGFLLTSCNSTETYTLEDYRVELSTTNEDFVVMQLADTHWGVSTNIPLYEEYYENLVDIINPDLIILTGDNILLGSKDTVYSLVSFLDSLNIPYTFTFGNHDQQGLYDHTWMLKTLASGENTIFKYMNDDLKGDGNQVVSISMNGTIAWEVYLIDTNHYRETGTTYDYDTIGEDQVEWMKAEKNLSLSLYGYIPPAISFNHIPLWELAYAIEDNPAGLIGEINQKDKEIENLSDLVGPVNFSPSGLYTNYIPEAMALNTKGFFFGHDHINDWVGMYEDVAIGFGVKSGRELEYAVSDDGFDITGAASYTLHSDGSFTIGHHYVDMDDFSIYNSAEVTIDA